MNISCSFGEIDIVGGSQPCQPSVDSIEEIVNRDIIRRLYPLTFEHSPEGLSNVEMRGIGRQEEEIKPPFLPDFSHFLHIFAAVHLGIVKHDECVLPYSKGEPVKEIRDAFGRIQLGCAIEIAEKQLHRTFQNLIEQLDDWRQKLYVKNRPSFQHISELLA